MDPTIYKPSIYKGAGIYKAGAEGGGGVPELPPEYKKLMYVYINANYESWFRYFYSHNSKDKLNLQMEMCLRDTFTSGSSSYEYYWAGNESARYYVDFNNNRSYFKIGWGESGSYLNTAYEAIERNKFVNISFYVDDTNTLIVNYNGAQYTRSLTQKTENLCVFSYRDYYNYINTKLFSLTIYDGNTDKVKRQYIPVIRVADSVPGIYDLITGQFVRGKNAGGSNTNGISAGPIIE